MSVRKSGQIIAGTPRTTGGVEIGDMGFAPLGIDESLNLRRYMNGQLISQTQFVSFTTKVKSAVALFPNLGTTETNWQAEKALSKFGQVGKFVVDDAAGTIRLPAVVNPQGLLELSGIGNLVNESLPNITGSFSVVGAEGSVAPAGAFVGGTFNAFEAGVAGTAGILTGFDASHSAPTYQNYAHVQQEAIQYPYYIQVATGIEETLPAIREYEINTPFFFGWSQYFENAPYNASLLASNGQYNASSLYPDIWTQLTGVELNGSLVKGDTIEISGKTYVKRGLPVKLSTATYDDYDFVVNTSDQTFRLPLLNGEEDLPSDSYDDLTLTTTTQRFTAPANGIYTVSGIGFTWVDLTNETAGEFGSCSQPRTADGYGRYTVKAKRGDQIVAFCGAIPSSYACRFVYAKGNGTLYYYVGDTVQDASLINAGAVLGQLANKADIDASNFNADGKSLLSGLGMPSGRYIDLTLGASGATYTAPANGWVSLAKRTTAANQFIFLGQIPNRTNVISYSPVSGGYCQAFIAVRKGDTFVAEYNAGGEVAQFRFTYAEGDNNV